MTYRLQILIIMVGILFAGALFPQSHLIPAAMAESETVAPAAVQDKLYLDLYELLREYYPKAKITKSENKIHFEYKARPNLDTKTKRQEIIPAFGGVIGDIEFKPGPYKGRVRLPQQFAEYAFYSVILMAPYVQSSNSHIYVRLEYPSDALHDFTDRFQDLINSFGEGTAPAEPDPRKSERPRQPVVSETQRKRELAPPVIPKERKLSFWKAVKEGTVVYIFPTIGFGKHRYYPLAGEVAKAFNESKLLAVDSHLGLPSDPFSMGCYQADDKLSNHIRPETQRKLDELVAWSGEPIEIYNVWKPYFLCTSFDSSLIRQIGFNVLDLEKQIVREAKQSGKPIFELEPAIARVEYFDTLPAEIQDLCVRLSLFDILDYESQQYKLEEAWLLGDQERVKDVLMTSARKNPELLPAYEKLYQDSNRLMVPLLEVALKKISPIFVSLDYRRVVGDKGLLAHLHSEGYLVEQVSGIGPIAEGGVLAELPYIEDGGEQSKEITPYGKAAEHYRAKRFKEALEILSTTAANDERSRYLKGLCYAAQDQVQLAANEFLWVIRNARDMKLRENAGAAMRSLR